MKTSIATLALLFGITETQAMSMKNLQRDIKISSDTEPYEQQYLDAHRGFTEARKEQEKRLDELQKKSYNKFTDIKGNYDENEFIPHYLASAAHDRYLQKLIRKQALADEQEEHEIVARAKSQLLFEQKKQHHHKRRHHGDENVQLGFVDIADSLLAEVTNEGKKATSQNWYKADGRYREENPYLVQIDGVEEEAKTAEAKKVEDSNGAIAKIAEKDSKSKSESEYEKKQKAKGDRSRWTGNWEEHYINTNRAPPKQIVPPQFHDENGCGDVYDLKHSAFIVPTTVCGKGGHVEAGKIYNQKLQDLQNDKYTPLDQQLENSITQDEIKPKQDTTPKEGGADKTVKPKDGEAAAKPKKGEEATKPKEGDDAAKPKDGEEAAKPKEGESKSDKKETSESTKTAEAAPKAPEASQPPASSFIQMKQKDYYGMDNSWEMPPPARATFWDKNGCKHHYVSPKTWGDLAGFEDELELECPAGAGPHKAQALGDKYDTTKAPVLQEEGDVAKNVQSQVMAVDTVPQDAKASSLQAIGGERQENLTREEVLAAKKGQLNAKDKATETIAKDSITESPHVDTLIKEALTARDQRIKVEAQEEQDEGAD